MAEEQTLEDRVSRLEREQDYHRLLLLGIFIIVVVGAWSFKAAFASVVEILNDTVVIDNGPAVYRPWENPLKAEQLEWLVNKTDYKTQ